MVLSKRFIDEEDFWNSPADAYNLLKNLAPTIFDNILLLIDGFLLFLFQIYAQLQYFIFSKITRVNPGSSFLWLDLLLLIAVALSAVFPLRLVIVQPYGTECMVQNISHGTECITDTSAIFCVTGDTLAIWINLHRRIHRLWPRQLLCWPLRSENNCSEKMVSSNYFQNALSQASYFRRSG